MASYWIQWRVFRLKRTHVPSVASRDFLSSPRSVALSLLLRLRFRLRFRCFHRFAWLRCQDLGLIGNHSAIPPCLLANIAFKFPFMRLPIFRPVYPELTR